MNLLILIICLFSSALFAKDSLEDPSPFQILLEQRGTLAAEYRKTINLLSQENLPKNKQKYLLNRIRTIRRKLGKV